MFQTACLKRAEYPVRSAERSRNCGLALTSAEIVFEFYFRFTMGSFPASLNNIDQTWLENYQFTVCYWTAAQCSHRLVPILFCCRAPDAHQKAPDDHQKAPTTIRRTVELSEELVSKSERWFHRNGVEQHRVLCKGCSNIHQDSSKYLESKQR